MRSARRLLAALILCGIGAVTLEASAHQLRAAYTTVKLNARTGQLEVVHRFFLHDAEHAVQVIANRPVDLIDDEQDQLAFGDYAARRFHLWRTDGTELQLTYVGAETEGDFIWVYQEVPMTEDPPGLVVEATALHDVWPDQLNTVNVEFAEVLRTLEFRPGDARQAALP